MRGYRVISSSDGILPVIMCTYRRPHRLSATVDQLNAQQGVSPHLYIWNNNPAISSEVDAVVSRARFPVEVHHHPTNIGGFGRFHYARRLARRHKRVVFLDDDVDFGPETLQVLRREHRRHTIWSFWAFLFESVDEYWPRLHGVPGQLVDYCGTGGMICDASLFRDRGLFRCPPEYTFVEDLWLSYYAGHIRKWKLFKSGAPMRLVEEDGQDQFITLFEQKNEFYRQLVARGWLTAAGSRQPDGASR